MKSNVAKPGTSILRTGLLVVAQLLWVAGAEAQIIPRPPQINAASYIVLDATTGEVLIEENADERRSPASLTKIMTTYVADKEIEAGHITLDDDVFVSVRAWSLDCGSNSSCMFIKEGDHVRLEDIMRGIIIQSGNDASIALAEHIAGSEDAFADLMNQYADQLGMLNSQFMNAHGLDVEGHYSSARDLALLARAVITEFPESYGMYSEQEFTYNGITQRNRNSLLFTDRNVDGMKTGYTSQAGYCLVASAKRDDMRLITVVLGATSEAGRAQETQKLMTYGFRYFQTYEMFSGNEPLENVQVWYGNTNSVNVGVAEPRTVTIPRGEDANLVTELEIDEDLKAPIASGQTLGRIKVSLGDTVHYEGPVVAMEAVEKGSFFKRLMDWLNLFFLSLFS
jgi:D-alanyl-D-alanine carboxypeptidase (penicillin-binding protein 5/6)